MSIMLRMEAQKEGQGENAGKRRTKLLDQLWSCPRFFGQLGKTKNRKTRKKLKRKEKDSKKKRSEKKEKYVENKGRKRINNPRENKNKL